MPRRSFRSSALSGSSTLSIDGDTVAISAEVKNEKEVKDDERVLRSERYFGKVSRSFQLGQDIDDAAANARFVDGVLELTLPKKSVAARRQIAIQ